VDFWRSDKEVNHMLPAEWMRAEIPDGPEHQEDVEIVHRYALAVCPPLDTEEQMPGKGNNIENQEQQVHPRETNALVPALPKYHRA